MDVTKTKYFNVCYKLNERKLEELVNIIKNNSEKITFDVRCIDGTSMQFEELSELINYPNRKEKQYKEIEINNTYKSDVNIRITFTYLEGGAINYRVSGDEKEVDHLSKQIEELIMSTKQWYNILGNGFSGIVILSLAKTFIFYCALIIVLDTNSKIYDYIPLFFSLSLFVSMKTRKFLFPIYSFELGDGIERIETMNKIRNFILVTVLSSVVVGILVNIISSRL